MEPPYVVVPDADSDSDADADADPRQAGKEREWSFIQTLEETSPRRAAGTRRASKASSKRVSRDLEVALELPPVVDPTSPPQEMRKPDDHDTTAPAELTGGPLFAGAKASFGTAPSGEPSRAESPGPEERSPAPDALRPGNFGAGWKRKAGIRYLGLEDGAPAPLA
jgi:hypothetical protein